MSLRGNAVLRLDMTHAYANRTLKCEYEVMSFSARHCRGNVSIYIVHSIVCVLY